MRRQTQPWERASRPVKSSQRFPGAIAARIPIRFLCRMRCFLLVALAATLAAGRAADPSPLVIRGHAHNDYEHKRPLFDALDEGFCSIEADVFLIKGDLWVAHSRGGLKPERTLTRLYLDPLLERVRQRHGHVYETPEPVVLLIDIKEDGPAVYAALKTLLPRYSEMLTEFHGARKDERAVTVVLSGDRPRSLVAADPDRWCALDGLPEDLTGDTSAALVPWVSLDWSSEFRWRGVGKISETDSRKLAEMIRNGHAHGRRLRFWGSPDTPVFWEALDHAGVDYINTDKLAELRQYVLAHPFAAGR